MLDRLAAKIIPPHAKWIFSPASCASPTSSSHMWCRVSIINTSSCIFTHKHGSHIWCRLASFGRCDTYMTRRNDQTHHCTSSRGNHTPIHRRRRRRDLTTKHASSIGIYSGGLSKCKTSQTIYERIICIPSIYERAMQYSGLDYLKKKNISYASWYMKRGRVCIPWVDRVTLEPFGVIHGKVR